MVSSFLAFVRNMPKDRIYGLEVIFAAFFAGVISYFIISPALAWMVSILRTALENNTKKQVNQKLIDSLTSLETNISESWTAFLIIVVLVAILLMYLRFCVQDGYTFFSF